MIRFMIFFNPFRNGERSWGRSVLHHTVIFKYGANVSCAQQNKKGKEVKKFPAQNKKPTLDAE